MESVCSLYGAHPITVLESIGIYFGVFLQVHAYSILAAVLVLMSRLGIDSL